MSEKKKMFSGFRYDRLDAGENAFFERELETVAAESYDVQYPDLKARQIMPSGSFGTDPADETYTFRTYDLAGEADLIVDYAADLKNVSETGVETRTSIHSYGDGFQYSIQELKAGAKQKRPLDVARAKKARQAYELLLERVGAVGDSRVGSYGLLNQPLAGSFTLPNGSISGAKLWSGKTPDEIANDVSGICLAMIGDTDDVEHPDSLVLPSTQYGLLATRRISDATSDTVLDFIKQKNPWIKNLIPWDKCKSAGAGGTTDRMCAFRNAEDKLKFVISQEYEVQPPQAKNLAFVVPAYGRTAGVIVHYPKSIYYADGL